MGLLVSTVLVGIVIWVSRQRLSPEKELAIAIRRREFVVHYQPIIDLSNGRCVAAEALLRWRRPDGRWIRPDLFIPLAEDTGLISPLTDLLIERVIEDQAELLRADRGLHISINISARDLESGRFLPVLSDAVARSGIEPSQIWIEATEQGFIRAEIAASAIKAARAAGHMVAIDDFGTGYSSLSLLQGLPLDALKIDKSFVEAIATDAATSVVTPHIIDMAHGLKLRIIAEGVETREQEAYLRAAGVPLAQGWLYSRALPAAESQPSVRAATPRETTAPPMPAGAMQDRATAPSRRDRSRGAGAGSIPRPVRSRRGGAASPPRNRRSDRAAPPPPRAPPRQSGNRRPASARRARRRRRAGEMVERDDQGEREATAEPRPGAARPEQRRGGWRGRQPGETAGLERHGQP
ncbi:EAL domain-containing protein [Rhizorhabdus histidinilytica]